ncbi:Rossmann-like domain-containing protein [Bacillus alkalicellulosilyticus]|uniref:Rossmann-like domain-containing protein n=1 Tax=Alkalihalobacterium alkalicellulosilyticum TaxID=1912214 RepID=UPI000996E5A8|nr:DUF364 domain-containing protein [Bacillus alkalicellulosilyticus]
MKSFQTQDYSSVDDLKKSIVEGRIGPKPETFSITGASYIYQTTQFPSSTTKYHNYYLLLRVGSYFGACAHTPEQLDVDIAESMSGMPLDTTIEDSRLPVRIAGIDAYLGVVYPHSENCSKVVTLPAGTPVERAVFRDNLIAEMTDIKEGQKVALIGVVNPLVEAITKRGATCLPCDYQLKETQWGDVVEKDMEIVLGNADSVICTAMTLSNGTFDRILERVRERRIPLTVYAQTGSAVVAQFINNGVTSLIAEPFPFSQFNASESQLYCYKAVKGE